MRFTRPVNREVQIDGSTYIVTFDEAGISFRLKGKRKLIHANWTGVLQVAQENQTATAPESLSGGGDRAREQNQEGTQRAVEPQDDQTTDQQDSELSRTATAGETTPEN